MLLGSFITSRRYTVEDNGQSTVSVPLRTLTVGGELDGLAHVTHLAVSFFH